MVLLLSMGVTVLQELLALPAITPAILEKFEAEVAATGSEKEQRFIIRKLLMQSGRPLLLQLACHWAHRTSNNGTCLLAD